MASAYSPEQIDRWMEYVSIPERYRREANPPLNIDFLSVLHTHQLERIPYDNLAIHYSADHQIKLEPQHLYRKLTQNGRGGE